MKLIEYDRRPDIKEVHLSAIPMIVWITSRTKLEIDPGDTIRTVALAVYQPMGITKGEARVIVAYWFGLGERFSKGLTGRRWGKFELNRSLNREYDPY